MPSPHRPASWRAEAGESRNQVAAICYRIRKLRIEFLLVRTRKGRWTFPKGGVVVGLTGAQSAALEAFEEAGVHGRIEESSFTRYSLRKRGSSTPSPVRAHLCEVLRLQVPQEENRNPTWFSPEATVSCLQERRSIEDGRELARVVARAIARIRRLNRGRGFNADPLQRVQFENPGVKVHTFITRTALMGHLRGVQPRTEPPLLDFEPDSGKVVRITSRANRFPK